jgi:hypothetical protein
MLRPAARNFMPIMAPGSGNPAICLEFLALQAYTEYGSRQMPISKPPKRFGQVTWNGRLVVDVNKLYRSAQTQKTLKDLGEKIVKPPSPPNDSAYKRSA